MGTEVCRRREVKRVRPYPYVDKQFYPSMAPRESMGRFKEKGGRVREKDDATRKDRFGERHFYAADVVRAEGMGGSRTVQQKSAGEDNVKEQMGSCF